MSIRYVRYVGLHCCTSSQYRRKTRNRLWLTLCLMNRVIQRARKVCVLVEPLPLLYMQETRSIICTRLRERILQECDKASGPLS